MSLTRMINSSFFLAVLLLLTGCDSGAREIGGVVGKFCVPRAYRVGELWWVDANPAVDSLGFSFHGCSFARLGPDDPCELPREVVGADVEPRFLNDHVYWRSMKGSASLLGLESPAAVFERLDGGRTIVASVVDADNDWRVFAREASVGSDVRGLVDSDALLLRCGRETGISKVKYACTRYYRGPRYSVRYGFNSNERVPLAEMEKFDEALVRVIDGWQCDR